MVTSPTCWGVAEYSGVESLFPGRRRPWNGSTSGTQWAVADLGHESIHTIYSLGLYLEGTWVAVSLGLSRDVSYSGRKMCNAFKDGGKAGSIAIFGWVLVWLMRWFDRSNQMFKFILVSVATFITFVSFTTRPPVHILFLLVCSCFYFLFFVMLWFMSGFYFLWLVGGTNQRADPFSCLASSGPWWLVRCSITLV